MSRNACRVLLFAGLALLVSPRISAQWWSGNEKVKDEPWRKGNGTFGAMLLLTPDFEKFLEEWKKPETPAISITKTAERNKRLDAAIIFTGCIQKGGNCNVEVDFIVVRPDGVEYGSEKQVPAWRNKPGAPKGVLQVSEATLAIIIEPQDPSGTYIVKALVRDLNASSALQLMQTLTVK